MNKKDYILIADSIVAGISEYLSSNNKKTEDMDIQLVACLVTSISSGLYSQNTSFNETVFNNHILKRIRCLNLPD